MLFRSGYPALLHVKLCVSQLTTSVYEPEMKFSILAGTFFEQHSLHRVLVHSRHPSSKPGTAQDDLLSFLAHNARLVNSKESCHRQGPRITRSGLAGVICTGGIALYELQRHSYTKPYDLASLARYLKLATRARSALFLPSDGSFCCARHACYSVHMTPIWR